eukprot:354665-Chlamydomonas_euryale.AAC.3
MRPSPHTPQHIQMHAPLAAHQGFHDDGSGALRPSLAIHMSSCEGRGEHIYRHSGQGSTLP